MTLYVDMDGVTFDWHRSASRIIPTLQKEISDGFKWEDLYAGEPFMYRDMELMADAMILWNYIQHHNPEILTAIPRRFQWPECCAQKREAVYRKFGPTVKVNFGPFAIDKQFYCRNPSDVLIDDHEMNIDQWIARGGIGILHTSASDTIRQLKEFNL